MIIEWRILSRSFSFEGGELGHNRKMRRDKILDKYGALVRDLFTSCNDPVHKHSNLGVDPFPHQLTLILEEEERQSSQNSPDLEDAVLNIELMNDCHNSRTYSNKNSNQPDVQPQNCYNLKEVDLQQEKEKVSRK